MEINKIINEAVEKAESLSNALNDAIDCGIYTPTRTLRYSIDNHFANTLKQGLTKKGNSGFQVDESNLEIRMKHKYLNK